MLGATTLSKIQFPSSSNGGEIRGNVGEISLSTNDQQWQTNSPQLFSTTVASSGFRQQILRPQNWLHKSGSSGGGPVAASMDATTTVPSGWGAVGALFLSTGGSVRSLSNSGKVNEVKD
ncbi:putative transcription factor APETALA2 [Forsythia ovata]|uniref:Transcription factor APETALA2 n=1 Tax=Forsythia ovata TaxID=205694 RepID=A0ABD1WZJ0_9LAMI